MSFAISAIPASFKRLVLPAVVLTLVLLYPRRLPAQAAGTPGTMAGTPGGQGESAAKKPEHHKRTPQEVEETIRKRNGNFKKSPKIKNTHYKEDQEIAALRAALEELKAGRSRDRNKAKGSSGENTNAGGSSPAGGNPAGSNPVGAGSGKTSGGGASTRTSNPPGTPVGGTPGTPLGGTPGTSAGTGKPSVGVPMMVAPRAAVAITPASAPPSSGSSSGSPAAGRSAVSGVAPKISSVLGCSTKSVMIQSVNGVATGVTNPKIVFTQDPQYNDYKISGCNFGQSQGQAYLNGPFRSGQVALQIQSWTDSEIEVKVAPNLTGEPDQNNVTLTIAPTANAPGRLQNCKFYALRQEVTLTRFPQTQVTLAPIVDDAGETVRNVKYSSPYNGLGGQDLQSSQTTLAGGVDRFNETRFNPQGTDIWDLSTLAPGFVPTQFSLSHWNGTCLSGGFGIGIDDQTQYTDGQWGAQWDPGNPKRVIVNLAEWHCHSTNSGDTSNSSYALEIQVTGPIGVNPWP